MDSEPPVIGHLDAKVSEPQRLVIPVCWSVAAIQSGCANRGVDLSSIFAGSFASEKRPLADQGRQKHKSDSGAG